MKKHERNKIPIITVLVDGACSNFSMHEFENADGLVMIHSSIPVALECVRRDLAIAMGEEVIVIIKDAVRTQASLEALADKLGWTDEGGAVSRDSKHLAKHGGIAVDIVCRIKSTRDRVPQKEVGTACRRYFSYVEDGYHDRHVHADMREQTEHKGGNDNA